jgi:hypothetical protein
MADVPGVDPFLLPLADNGCVTPLPDGTCLPTVGFSPNSIVVDAGLCSLSGITTDARGYPRPRDVIGEANAASSDGCDIGAKELDANDYLAVDVAESVDPVIPGSGAGNLTYTVTLSNIGFGATNVVISVPLPTLTGVSEVSVTPSFGSWNGSADTWTVPDIGAAHPSATLIVVLTVGANAPSGTDVITLAATATHIDQVDDGGLRPGDSESTTVRGKLIFASSFEAGDPTFLFVFD